MRSCSRPAPGTQIRLFHAAASLPAGWDDQLPDGHFLRRDVLQVHEETQLPDMRAIYAGIAGPDGQWLARAAFQVLTLRNRHLNEKALKPWQRVAWRLFSQSVRPKLLVAGQLFRHDVSSFAWQRDLSPFDAFRYFRQIIDTVAREACVKAVLVKETPAAFVPYFLHHAPEYMMLRNDSSMQLQLPASWATFRDYEQALKHKYAQRLRKVRQPWASLEVRELTAMEVGQHADRMYELYLQVTRHQPVRLGMLSRNFLPALKSFYGDKLKIWGMFEAGHLVAFASAWVRDNSFDMFYIGFDYERNAALNLYFNILYFSVEQAILLRKPTLILGRTALEAKARVGCRPEYLHTFLYIRNGTIRNIVGRMQQRFAEGGEEWENRHPFRPGAAD